MIVNIPTSADFERLADDCLNQAFDLIFETDKYIFNHPGAERKDEVWAYSHGKLNTAVVLMHQAIEALMKASICSISPLLLLEGKRTEWPVMPQQKDKDFNDFYTTPAEALMHTYAATASTKLDEAVIKHIDEMRRLRNQIVHGISTTKLSPRALIAGILNTYLFFRGKDVWWESLLKGHMSNPLTLNYSLAREVAEFAERLEYVRAYLGKSSLAKHFALNISGRAYYCPWCKQAWEEDIKLDAYEHKWAFLKPNKPAATTVQCLNCGIDSDVCREPCSEGCSGNVVYYGETPEDIICLTCGRMQFDRSLEGELVQGEPQS